MFKKIKVRSIKTILVSVTKDDIIKAARAFHSDIPDDCEVTVRIPGGGDWSNTNLDIDDECPIIIKYEVIMEKEV